MLCFHEESPGDSRTKKTQHANIVRDFFFPFRESYVRGEKLSHLNAALLIITDIVSKCLI